MEEEQVVETPQVDEYEVAARQDNWVPLEEWKGPKEAWVDAKTFVERGKQINAILRSNNERLLRQLDEQKRQMDSLKLTTEEFKKFVKEQTDQKLKIYENEIKLLKEEKKKAVTEGDGERVVEIDDQIEALRGEQAAAKVEPVKEEPKPQASVEPAPEVKEWVSSNSWYTQDSYMQAAANKLAEEINLYQPQLKGKAFFEALDAALEKKFTLDALGREKKTKPRNPVEGSGANAPVQDSGKKGFNDLPSDAKKECDRFIKEGLFKSREEYLSFYEWE